MHRRNDWRLWTTQRGQQAQKEKNVVCMNHIGTLKDTAHPEPGIHRRRNADHRLQIHRRDPDDLDPIGHFFRWPAVGIRRYDSDFVTEFQEVVCELLDDAFDAAADIREIVVTHEYNLQGLPPPCE